MFHVKHYGRYSFLNYWLLFNCSFILIQRKPGYPQKIVYIYAVINTLATYITINSKVINMLKQNIKDKGKEKYEKLYKVYSFVSREIYNEMFSN